MTKLKFKKLCRSCKTFFAPEKTIRQDYCKKCYKKIKDSSKKYWSERGREKK